MGINSKERQTARSEIIQWLQFFALVGTCAAVFYAAGGKNQQLSDLVKVMDTMVQTVQQHELRIQSIEITNQYNREPR